MQHAAQQAEGKWKEGPAPTSFATDDWALRELKIWGALELLFQTPTLGMFSRAGPAHGCLDTMEKGFNGNQIKEEANGL